LAFFFSTVCVHSTAVCRHGVCLLAPFPTPHTTPRSRCGTEPIDIGDLPSQRRFSFRLDFFQSPSSVVTHEPCPLQANCRGLTLPAPLPDHQPSPGKGRITTTPPRSGAALEKALGHTLPSPTNKLHDRVRRTACSAADHIGGGRGGLHSWLRWLFRGTFTPGTDSLRPVSIICIPNLPWRPAWLIRHRPPQASPALSPAH